MGKRAQDKVRSKKGAEIIRTTGKARRDEVFRKPETAGIWDRVSRIKIGSKDECLDAFVRTVREVEEKRYKFKEGATDMGNYFVVNEPERNGSSFVHIVPAETYRIFEEVRREMPTSFLGFSMLCGRNGRKDLRVSCFAIPTFEITKAFVSRK